MRCLLAAFLFVSINVYAQDLEPNLEIFRQLLGKTWVAHGTWGNGAIFKQEITFKSDLGGNVIHTSSDGFVDEDQSSWGKRNHGIRKWDEQSGKLKFWEFDVFGGLTEGTIEVVGKDFYYSYNYGGSQITDAWIWKDNRTYTLKVGTYIEGVWGQVYLESEFMALPKYTGPREDLDALLAGMKAFSNTYMEGDHEAISQFYTEEGKIMPNGTLIIKGKEAIANRWKLPEGSRVLYHKIYPEEIHIIGDTAYDYGYYEGRSQAVGKEPSDWKGKYVIIWKKIDGRWLMDIDIWNRVNQ